MSWSGPLHARQVVATQLSSPGPASCEKMHGPSPRSPLGTDYNAFDISRFAKIPDTDYGAFTFSSLAKILSLRRKNECLHENLRFEIDLSWKFHRQPWEIIFFDSRNFLCQMICMDKTQKWLYLRNKDRYGPGPKAETRFIRVATKFFLHFYLGQRRD